MSIENSLNENNIVEKIKEHRRINKQKIFNNSVFSVVLLFMTILFLTYPQNITAAVFLGAGSITFISKLIYHVANKNMIKLNDQKFEFVFMDDYYQGIEKAFLFSLESFEYMKITVDRENNYTVYKESNEIIDTEQKEEKKEISSHSINSIKSIVETVVLNDQEYLVNPAIGREKELEKLIVSLLTPDKSVIITGETGVGKTALVEGLCYKIKNDEVPEVLKNKKILKINSSSMVSGCHYVGMFEKKVESIIKEIKKDKDIILFIDEIHTVIGAGTGEKSNIDLANMLKPFLDRGQIKLIGTTTDEEYDKYIQRDKAFNRRFNKISLTEPTNETTYKILDGVIPKIEEVTKIKFIVDSDLRKKVLNNIVKCSNKKHRKYNETSNNPDLCLGILKSAFAYAQYRDHAIVEINDINDAIKSCETLYENRNQNMLYQEDAPLDNSKTLKLGKVIQFNNKGNK